MVAKRWKMDEDHGEEYVMLPFLADEELISISGWKRIADRREDHARRFREPLPGGGPPPPRAPSQGG